MGNAEMSKSTPKNVVKSTVKTTRSEVVKGGAITREADTGALVSVRLGTSVHLTRPKSVETIEKISNRRSAALERLANR